MLFKQKPINTFHLQENKSEVLHLFAALSQAVNRTADCTAASSGPPCPALWKKPCRTPGPYRAGSPSPSPVAPAAAAKPHVICVTSMLLIHMSVVQTSWVLSPTVVFSSWELFSDEFWPGAFRFFPTASEKKPKLNRDWATLQKSYGVKQRRSPFFAFFTGAAEPGKETSTLSPSKLAVGGTKPGVAETHIMLKITGITGGMREPRVDYITWQSLLQQSLKVSNVLQTGHYLHLYVNIFLLTEWVDHL